jgi:hypothetical protein
MKIDRSILQANNQEIGQFGDPDKIENSIAHVADIVDSNDNETQTLKTDNTSNKGRLTVLEGDVSVLKTDNISNKSGITNNENAVASNEARLDNLLRDTQKASEVVDARRKADGTVYPLLGDRMNAVDADLAETQTELSKTMKNGVTLSEFANINDAINYAVANNVPSIYLDAPTISINGIDFKGLNVIGANTEITGIPKGVKSLRGAIYRGIDQDDRQVGEFGSLSGTVTTKIFQKVSESEFHVYSKKPFTNEYLDFRFENGIFSSTDSAGSPAELMRLTGVFNLTKAYVQNNTFKNKQGTWDYYEMLLDSASGIPNARNYPLKFYRNTTDVGWIEFEAYANDEGEISLGFYTTATSEMAAPISINGVSAGTVNLRGDADFIIKKIKGNYKGTVTVKIEKPSTAPVYVTSNLYKLHEAPTDAKFDNVAFFDNSEAYIGNKGALDYAMVDENGLYWGSYHGGETLVSRATLADKIAVGATLPGRIFPCKSFRMDQTTQIGTLFESRTSMRISRDGFFDFDFSLVGDAVLQTIYTTMTTTENKFRYVTYPKLLPTGTDGTYYFGKANRITQEDIITRQKITTLFTRYENENNSNGGVFVQTTVGAYNKVYYGPVVGGLRRIKELYGSNTRIFE